MAEAVESALADKKHLIVEAGTGTGKTLAYLVPAILSRQRVLVSTGTKNLQEQIFFKDIPTLKATLDVPFTATYMKGRGNYLCLHRLDQLQEGGTPLVPAVRLSEALGVEVRLKVEGANPTGSFKDRGMTMAISKAVEEGAEAVICASTGNTSASAAALIVRLPEPACLR